MAHSEIYYFGSKYRAMSKNPKHVFIVSADSKRNGQRLFEGEYFITIAEDKLKILRGFISEEFSGDISMSLAMGQIIGAVLDPEFANDNPDVVTSLQQIIPSFGRHNPVYIFSGDVPSLLEWLSGRALGIAEAILEELYLNQIEIAGLQRIIQENMESLNEVENLFKGALAPAPKLAVFLPPSNEHISLPIVGTAGEITQSTKREFRWLSAFEIHVAVSNPDSQSQLQIRASSSHSKTSIATWTLDISELDAGWNKFRCPPIDTVLNEPVDISIRWTKAPANSFALSVGKPTADPRLRLRTCLGSEIEKPLALKAYEGLIPLRNVMVDWGWRADGAHAERRKTAIDASDLLKRASKLTGRQSASNDDGHLKFEDEKGGLLVHPYRDCPNISVIRNIRIDEAREIATDVALMHDEAAETEFGLFACPSKMSSKLSWSSFSIEPKDQVRHRSVLEATNHHSSGPELIPDVEWLTLQAGERGRLIFKNEQPMENKLDIYLLTRPTSSNTQYAWAYFVSLSIL